MKRQTVIFSISIILIIICVLGACQSNANQSFLPSHDSAQVQSDQENYASAIIALEMQIEELMNDQSASDEERTKELEALRAELDALKKAESSSIHEESTSESAETDRVSGTVFLYTVSEDGATIVGYNGNDTNIVIPSFIDGYKVIKIGENAFTSPKIKRITITEGIVEIDWFAFDGCSALESITIPSSVKKIGYSAFSSTASSFTICCHSGSFAQNYAKSYGYSYTII